MQAQSENSSTELDLHRAVDTLSKLWPFSRMTPEYQEMSDYVDTKLKNKMWVQGLQGQEWSNDA
jgi:hypothetical protein